MSIARLITVVGNHWRLIVVLTAGMVGAAAVLTYSEVPKYRASTLLQVQASMGADGSVSLDDTLSARERAVTIADLGNTAQTAAVARASIGSLPGIDTCSFSQNGQSEFLTASCAGSAQRLVARAANAYAKALQSLLELQREQRISGLTDVYRRQIALLKQTGVSPSDYPAPPVFPSYRELEIIDTARMPASAFSPRPTRTLALALVLGLLLNSGIAFLLERVMNRARTPEELQAALGLRVLVAIPKLGRSAAPGVRRAGSSAAVGGEARVGMGGSA